MAEQPSSLRPRVLFVIGGLGAGGSEIQLCALVSRLHGRELDATVLVGVADPGPRLDRLHAAGVPVIEAGTSPAPSSVWRLSRAIWKTLRSTRPDAVYVWLEAMSTVTTPLSRAARIPVVVRRANIGGAQIERRRLYAWAVRRAERLASLVAPNSEAVLEQGVRRGLQRGRMRLVPNALADRPPVSPPPAPPVRIGYLARMRPEKGHLRLLRVLEGLPADLEWEVKLGGAGPLDGQIREAASRAGLLPRLVFCGEVVDSDPFWDDCHIGLLLSDQEGSPNSLLEAARAARPLLATAVGGSREVVVAGSGFLVDPADDRAAAEKLAELISDPQMRARFGARAREVTVSRHDPETVSAMHLAVLREAMGG